MEIGTFVVEYFQFTWFGAADACDAGVPRADPAPCAPCDTIVGRAAA